jgi:TRAP-type C4-dicarboxylate transport system permease small subunit
MVTGRRILRWLCEAPANAAGILLVLATLDILLQVGARAFASGGAPAWTEEAARVFLIWISFFGAAAASVSGEHIGVDGFSLSRRTRLIWDGLIEIFILVITLALLYGAWRLTNLTWTNTMPALGMTGAVVYMPVIIGAVIIILRAVVTLVLIGRSIAGHPTAYQVGERITPEI